MLGFTYSEVHKGFWGWWHVPESRHLFGLRYAALSQTTALGALVVCSKFQREDIVGIFWLHFFSRNNQWENITSDIISCRGRGGYSDSTLGSNALYVDDMPRETLPLPFAYGLWLDDDAIMVIFDNVYSQPLIPLTFMWSVVAKVLSVTTHECSCHGLN